MKKPEEKTNLKEREYFRMCYKMAAFDENRLPATFYR